MVESSKRKRAFFEACLAVALLTATRTASAAEGVEPVQLSYEGGDCEPRAAFLARVQRRTTRFELVSEGESREFRVRVLRRAPTLEGELEVRAAGAPPQLRRVSDTTCEGVLDALALMMALALDPLASAPLPDDAVTSSESAVPPPTPTPAPDEREGEAKPSEHAALSWAFGVHGTAHARVAPSWLLGVRGFVELNGRRSGLFSPELRVGGGYGRSFVTQTELGDASFRLLEGFVASCPLRSPRRWWQASACAHFEAGQLLASGSNAPGARRQARLWLSLGPALELDLRLERSLSLELGTALTFPLVRDRFGFGEQVVHEVPSLVPVVFLGLRAASAAAR